MSITDSKPHVPGHEWPLVSVIILNFNGIRFVEKCLRSVLASDYPNVEVIVVDNASTDGSYEVIRDQFGNLANLRLIRNESNLGFAAGNNTGYEYSRGEIVVFLNVDTLVEPDWLHELVGAMNSDPRIGAAQCKLVAMDDPGKIDGLGCYIDTLGYVYSWGQWYTTRPPKTSDEPFYAEGAALGVRRHAANQVLLNLVPFDPDYFCYYEDSDFCWRMRLRGFRVRLASGAVVHHYRSYAIRQSSPMAVFNSSKNRLSTLIKNYTLRNLLRWLPLLIILELLRAILHLKNQPKSAYAKFSAISWCLRNLRRIWRKRVYVQHFRSIPDSEIVKVMLGADFASLLRGLRLSEKATELSAV